MSVGPLGEAGCQSWSVLQTEGKISNVLNVGLTGGLHIHRLDISLAAG